MVPVITDTHYAVDVINKEDIRGNLKVLTISRILLNLQIWFSVTLRYTWEMWVKEEVQKQNTIDLQKVMALIGQVDCPYFISLGNHDDNRYGTERVEM